MGTLGGYNAQDLVCFQGLLFASCITQGKQLVAREHSFFFFHLSKLASIFCLTRVSPFIDVCRIPASCGYLGFRNTKLIVFFSHLSDFAGHRPITLFRPPFRGGREGHWSGCVVKSTLILAVRKRTVKMW